MMANSILAFRASLLLWMSLSVHLGQSTTIRGQLTDISSVSDIINYVKPYIKSLQLGPETVYKTAMSMPAPSPQMAIDEKIKQLEPYLQDNDIGEKLELEGEDETTIIEFTPRAHIINGTKHHDDTESFQANLRKYKKMRTKIKLALERESVSNKTKQIVTRTLDELIATLVQRQCPQGLFQNSDLKKLTRLRANFLENFFDPFKHCQLNGKNISEEECKKLLHFNISDKPCYIGSNNYSAEVCKKLEKNITDTINMKFKTFKEYIKALLPSKETQIINFYNSFTKTVSNILRDSDKIPEKYKVKCTLADVDKQSRKKSVRNKNACQDFRVCSEELREFLTVFYKSLNDTAVRAFRNYAAMYERDIVTDVSEEKNAVIATINHAADILEDRVSNAFIKTTAEIALDENKDREMNIAVLREYVKHTVKTINKTVNRHLEADISGLRARLLLPIKEDLAHNLGSDLGHFQSDVIKQICSFFITCIGNQPNLSRSQYLARKQFIIPRANSNSVFVNLELALDDDFKNMLMNNHKAMLQGLGANNVMALRSHYDTNNSNIVVTRTTIKTNDEAEPTTVVSLPISMENSNSYENDEDIKTNNLVMVRK